MKRGGGGVGWFGVGAGAGVKEGGGGAGWKARRCVGASGFPVSLFESAVCFVGRTERGHSGISSLASNTVRVISSDSGGG